MGVKVLTAAEVAEKRARAEKATPGKLSYDGYNRVWDEKQRVILDIPDHPKDDEWFKPEESTERSAWYAESANNADLFAHAAVDVIELGDTVEALRADRDRLKRLIEELPHTGICPASWKINAFTRLRCICIKSQIEVTR